MRYIHPHTQCGLSSSYSHLLLHCSTSKSLRPGSQIHGRLTHLGLSHHSKLRNHLITLYAKCRSFLYAHKLLAQMSTPDIVSWTSLISAYSHHSLHSHTLLTFLQARSLDLNLNEFAIPTVAKACGALRDLLTGMQVHASAIVTGLSLHLFVSNALLVMYAKCGEFFNSKRVFDEAPVKNVVSWNALFSCYVQGDLFETAVAFFHDMVSAGVHPDEFSLSSLVNAATGLRDPRLGLPIHGYLLKLGLELDRFSANALVDMYAKFGDVRASVSLFYSIENPDIVSWNAVIAACVLHGRHAQALKLFQRMLGFGMYPNMFTISSALKGCAGLGEIGIGGQVHSCLVKIKKKGDPFVGVGLVEMYSKCGMMAEAKVAFTLMQVKDAVAWNSIISGYYINGEDMEALRLFSEMNSRGIPLNQTTLPLVLRSAACIHEGTVPSQIHALSTKSGLQSDPYIVNSMIDSYGKCGMVDEASKVLASASSPDVMCFTSLITTYAQCGKGEDALKLFLEMSESGPRLDPFIFSAMLNACAGLSSHMAGKQVHGHVLKLGFMADAFAGNSMVNMYAKCGRIDEAGLVFSEIQDRGVVSYSAMVGGLAQHGEAKAALSLFESMVRCGVAPNHVTMVSVLSACSHAGMVEEASRHFETMKEVHGFEPTQEHYACMVDVLGRAGRLKEAVEMVEEMPYEPNAAVWGAVLGAARMHKAVETGRRAAEMLMKVEPEKSGGTLVLLANTYASAGMWGEVGEVRRMMRRGGVKKEPGVSWVEVREKVYTFLAGDLSHPRKDEIYKKVEELGEEMRKEGYVTAVDTDLHDVDRVEKEVLLIHHSERLAVAFALLVLPPGAPVRVMKNIRVCVDCHTAMKFISRIERKEIVVRDISRFHRFRDGICSCGDYW